MTLGPLAERVWWPSLVILAHGSAHGQKCSYRFLLTFTRPSRMAALRVISPWGSRIMSGPPSGRRYTSTPSPVTAPSTSASRDRERRRGPEVLDVDKPAGIPGQDGSGAVQPHEFALALGQVLPRAVVQ